MKIREDLKTIQGNLDSYMEAVISDDAGEIQIKETTLAFYAGAIVSHTLTINATSHEDEDKCMNELDLLFKELAKFKDKIEEEYSKT